MSKRLFLLLAIAPAASLWADSFGPGFAGYTIAPIFQNNVNSPGQQLIPVSYGGITLDPANANRLIVAGNAEGSGAAFYSSASLGTGPGISRDCLAARLFSRLRRKRPPGLSLALLLVPARSSSIRSHQAAAGRRGVDPVG